MFDSSAIHKTLLTAAVFFLYVAAARAGVVAHYNFDSNYNDSSGNGNHGTPFDGNGNASTAGVTITNNPGEYVFGGGAANFSEERDWISLSSHTFNSGSNYSISFWARDLTPTTSDGGMVIGRADNTNHFIWLDNNTAGGMRWRGNSSAAERQEDFSFTNDTNWHHYVFTTGDFDGQADDDDVRLYRDGLLIETTNDQLTGFIFDAIGEAYTSGSNFDFRGQIDEVWIFDETLTAQNVAFLFSSNVTTPEPASLALWAIGGLAAMAMCVRLRNSVQQ